MVSFEKQNLPGDNISPYTAMKLQKLLREVVINPNGTGKRFIDLPYEVAGKSGTAETGKYDNDNSSCTISGLLVISPTKIQNMRWLPSI